MKKKYDVEIVEIPAFANTDEAQNTLSKEEKKIKLNMIATGVALLGSIFFISAQSQSLSFLYTGIMEYITAAIYLAGLAATIALNPIKTFKSLFAFAKVGYNLVPFLFIDWLGFLAFFLVGLLGLFYVPVVYAAYNLYDSYKTIKEAKSFLGIAN